MSGVYVTRDEVYKAANEISGCGEMPSIKMVRTFLGDRGSESTLQKYLKEWKQELLQRGTGGCLFCTEADHQVKELHEQLFYASVEIDQYKQKIEELKVSLHTQIVMMQHASAGVSIAATENM